MDSLGPNWDGTRRVLWLQGERSPMTPDKLARPGRGHGGGEINRSKASRRSRSTRRTETRARDVKGHAPASPGGRNKPRPPSSDELQKPGWCLSSSCGTSGTLTAGGLIPAQQKWLPGRGQRLAPPPGLTEDLPHLPGGQTERLKHLALLISID